MADGQTTTISSGEFYCSSCNSRQSYDLNVEMREGGGFLSKLFGPKEKTRTVVCQNCGSNFLPAVLQTAGPSEDKEYLKGIRRVAIQMMAIDGSIDDEEVTAIQEMYTHLTGLDLDDASIRREAERVSQRTDDDLMQFLGDLKMDDKGRQLILKTAHWVVTSDDRFDEEEATLIYKVGGALGVSAADVRLMMDRMQLSG